MVCVLNSWTFFSSSIIVISSSTPVLIVWSIFSPCMYVFLCGWVCVFVCVNVCVVICLKLEIILFGGLLPDFCIVVPLNQPICICVECPILKPVTLCVLSTCWWPYCALLLLLSPLSYFVLGYRSVSVSTYILLCAHLPFFYIFRTLPIYIFVSLLLGLLILQLCSLYTSLTCYFLILLALTFLSPLLFPPSCVYPHLIPVISSLCLALLPPRSVVSQREPRELQPGVQQSPKQHRQWHEVPGATALEQHRLRQLQPHPPAARH